MRPLVLRLVLGLALALTGGTGGQAATPSPVPAAPAGGSVYITTLPSGADVWLDGAYLGHSPKLVDGLIAGRHTVTVAKAGWQGRDIPLAIGETGTPTLISALLDRSDAFPVRGTGQLVVHSIDALPATIEVDGATVPIPKGTCELAAGAHTLVLVTPRGRMTRRVTVYADMATEIVVRDEAEGEGSK